VIPPAVLAFLAMLHCVPSAQIVVASGLTIPGYYKAGVVVVRAMNDAVLVHELYHACQERSFGIAKSIGENAAREVEAKAVEVLWTEYVK